MRCVVCVVVFLFCFNSGYSREKTLITNGKDSSIVTSDGVKLYLKVSGQGAPCVFVHGGPGAWSESFTSLGGSALEKNLTMYYYDHRGSGRSESPPNGDYSLVRMVEDIENIRALTGSKKIYLLAHSFGGILAYSYAQKYPQHVEGLILLNATLNVYHSLLNQIKFVNEKLGTNFIASDTEAIIATYATAIKSLREKGYGYLMLSDNKDNVDNLDSVDNSIVRNYSFARAALSMPEYLADFTKGTGQVKVPVLVITGTADNNIGPEHYKLFRFPNQTVKVIEGGHILYYESNKAFKRAIWKFTNKN